MVQPPRKGFFGIGRVWDFPLNENGSVSMTIPSGIAYQLEGIGSKGEIVARDNTVHAAVPGETVTCHGCHDAHGVERQVMYGKTALERWVELKEKE